MFKRPDSISEPLHVVTTIFNSQRFRSRWYLYEQFAARMAASNVKLYTVEVTFGDRAQAISESPATPNYLRLQTTHELWHKERALNLMIERLPSDWKYLAWVDSDIQFTNPNWVNHTVHALQHYSIVQPWTEALDLDTDHHAFARHRSFCWAYEKDPEAVCSYDGRPKMNGQWHSGYAWAIRREAFDGLGGLMDHAILGSADKHMALALVGRGKEAGFPGCTDNYMDAILQWESRAERHIRRNIGFVNGTILHYWHGSKVKRGYADRWKILCDLQFDPYKDLKRDWQGLHQLDHDGTLRMTNLRDRVRNYLKERDEDSTVLPASERQF